MCCSVLSCVAVHSSVWSRRDSLLWNNLSPLAACCSVLQHVAACGSVWQWVILQRLAVGTHSFVSGVVLQCVAACCSGLQCCSVLRCVAVCYSVWIRQDSLMVHILSPLVVCCSVLQCVVAVFCRVLQRVSSPRLSTGTHFFATGIVLQRVPACCSVLQCVAVRCRHTDTHAPIYSDQNWSSNCQFPTQRVCVCCSVLQCVAGIPTHKLPCTALSNGVPILDVQLMCVTVCCSVLQRVAVCCSVLQCVAGIPTHMLPFTVIKTGAPILNFQLNVCACVAVCCSVLQTYRHTSCHVQRSAMEFQFSMSNSKCVAVCCSVLQCVAVRCSALQCVAVCCRRTDTHVALYGAQ